MSLSVKNPPAGYTYGTSGDDWFEVTDSGTDWRNLQGMAGVDTVIIDRSVDNYATVRIDDTFGHGNFDGRVMNAFGPYVDFNEMEDVRITGTPGNDRFEVTVRPT
jgi:hypothetical protein